MSGLLYCVCCLLAITISAQGDPWKLPWSNCGESLLCCIHTYMHSLITNSSPHVGTSNDTVHVTSVTMEPRPRIGYSHNITFIASLGITIVDMDMLPALFFNYILS